MRGEYVLCFPYRRSPRRHCRSFARHVCPRRVLRTGVVGQPSESPSQHGPTTTMSFRANCRGRPGDALDSERPGHAEASGGCGLRLRLLAERVPFSQSVEEDAPPRWRQLIRECYEARRCVLDADWNALMPRVLDGEIAFQNDSLKPSSFC